MNKGQYVIRTTIIGEAYPPCVAPLSSLEPIMLGELRLETHHRGKVLIVRAFTNSYRMSAIQSAIEDTNGDVDRLAIHNLPSTLEPEDVLPLHGVFALKEPYYKATSDGGVMVRVDHPSDFLVLEASDDLVPAQWKGKKKAVLSADELKTKGNAAFQGGKWHTALDHYTKALAVPDIGEDLRFTLHRNRAQAHLQLGQYEFAAEDAIAAVIPGDDLMEGPKSLNTKALFRAGRAHYELGDFLQAKEYFELASNLGVDRAAAVELERTNKRISEQELGNYDFDSMAISATATNHYLDHASFLGNTRIGQAGHRGRGLFATKFIPHGQIVLVEKAFYAAFKENNAKDVSILINLNTKHHTYGTHSERLFGCINKLRANPKQAAAFLDLHCSGTGAAKEAKVIDGIVVVDSFQVQAIAQLNGFGCSDIKPCSASTETSEVDRSTGIWLRASRANHSCVPNTGRAFIGDMMVVRAVRDISAGEEITMGYCHAAEPRSQRKERLASYGFTCDCVLCTAEARVAPKMLLQRAQGEEEAKALILANPCTSVSVAAAMPKVVLARARNLLARMRATYADAVYGEDGEGLILPRCGCVALALWCTQVAHITGNSIEASASLLRDLGYTLKVTGPSVVIGRQRGVVAPEAMDAAMYAAEAWSVVGRPGVTDELVAFAREMYLVIFGEMGGWEERYGSWMGVESAGVEQLSLSRATDK